MVATQRSPEPLYSYPDPVVPDESVDHARKQRLSDLTRITAYGVAARLLVILAEFLGVMWSGSSVLLVDAVASLFDVVSSLVLLAAIHVAARPPDEEHPFGHGRVEPLAGFQLGLVLCGVGIWMAGNNILELFQTPTIERMPGWLWAIPALATALLGLVAWRIHLVGREAHSTALLSEAVHYQIDMWTSLATAVTLILAAWLPSQVWMLDRSAAVVLALVVCTMGARAAMENFHQLLDRIPDEKEFTRVRNSALIVQGVFDVEKLRIQHAGPDAHVNIDIEVDPLSTVDASHQVAQQVRAQIQTDWPFVREVVVHVEPYYTGDHPPADDGSPAL